MAVYKNKASQKAPVYAYTLSTGAAKTGDAANITAQVSKDGGSAAAANDVNPTEADATNLPGVYLFDLSQAETNCDLLILAAKSSTSGVALEPLFVYTEPEIRDVNAAQISGDSAAADNAEAFFDGTGYAGTNNVIPTVTTATNLSNLPTMPTDWITAAGLSAGAVAEIVDALVARFGSAVTAQTGSTASSVVLDSGASSVDDFYNGSVLQFYSGALDGQARKITDYVGSTRTATVTAFTTAPSNGDAAIILGRIE